MRFLVDEVPERFEDCCFYDFDVDTEFPFCVLESGVICNLYFERPCKWLKALNDGTKGDDGE